MGTTLTALLQRPDMLDGGARRSAAAPAGHRGIGAVDADRPDVLPVRHRRHRLGGVELPAGSVVHIGIGPANRDPARWERPDEFDITRKMKPSLGFGQAAAHLPWHARGPRRDDRRHLALLDRLPNLRLDPDAEPPRFVGMYERGATAIPVLFDPA